MMMLRSSSSCGSTFAATTTKCPRWIAWLHLVLCCCCCCGSTPLGTVAAAMDPADSVVDDDGNDATHHPHSSMPYNQTQQQQAQQQQQQQKLDLWMRGEGVDDDTAMDSFFATTPVRPIRRRVWSDCQAGNCYHGGGSNAWSKLDLLRGGGTQQQQQQLKLEQLQAELGPAFVAALQQNEREHREDCQASCELFYCAPPDADEAASPIDLSKNTTWIRSYSMGAVPPEDFAQHFDFPLDLIKVTQGQALFSANQLDKVIATAVAEGVDDNEYTSGKYQLGGNWLDDLPATRVWFNQQLQHVFVPLLRDLFPQVVSSQSVVRAHSVSLLKYNASHPRTDVHVDNGLLALTVAMTPQSQYTGGGTFFEHLSSPNSLVKMDVGHATLRPGSVRHGGHRVTHGVRYVLGAFFLLEDRVEHVRRLKNRGAALRAKGQLEHAAQHFDWALRLNPKCTTCLKDWAEVLHTQGNHAAAEKKIRTALELLEEKDSDALFTLGVLLSEQGRHEEALAAYRQSVALNTEDAELLYNLGVKLGQLNDNDDNQNQKEELQMYARAVQADPNMAGAWLNWGTAVAQQGNLDEAEALFVKAALCKPKNTHKVNNNINDSAIPKALMNLCLLYQQKTKQCVQRREMGQAQQLARQASQYADQAKPLLDQFASLQDTTLVQHLQQFPQQRLNCYRMVGELAAMTGDWATAETEFRAAVQQFPEQPQAWQFLQRVLQRVGGHDTEVQEIAATLQTLR